MSNHSEEVKVAMYTMCLVVDGDQVLLVNRPSKRGFPGYIGPGGKVDFPESITEGAIREVREETGLHVKDLVYKGLDEYVDPNKNFRYMVFNYVARSFEGELLQNPPEGELRWVPFKRRFPLFFEEGTFEIHKVWDEEQQLMLQDTVKRL